MSARSLSLANVRDVLLVAMVVTLAFAAGAVAAHSEDLRGTLGLVSISYRGVPGDRTSAGDELRSFSPLRATSPMEDRHTGPTRNRPRSAPAPPAAPTPPPSIPRERFAGDGAMRREIALLHKAYSGRVYLLETASLLHRRGWIGLEDRVAEIASGSIDNPVRPMAQAGPR